MSWMVYTFTAGIFYILPNQISWLEMQLGLTAWKSSEWAELMLGNTKNNLSWLPYFKKNQTKQPPKNSNKPTNFNSSTAWAS